MVPSPERSFWYRAFGAVQRGKEWVYPAYYPLGHWALTDLQKIDPTLQFDPSTYPLLRELQLADELLTRSEAEYAAGQRVTLPDHATFTVEPYNHQRLGIARLLSSCRAFFLWEMGTGKTKTAVEAMKLLRREGRFKKALILAPPVVLPTWEREVALWAPGELTTLIWRGQDPSLPERAAKADVVITSYSQMRIERAKALEEKRESRLLQIDYDTIIADESHSLGEFDSQQTQAGLELSAKALRRVLLTGTAADHPKKLYPQLRFLSPALMPLSWREYQDKYMVFSKDPNRKYMVVGFKFMAELNATVDRVATRMKKKDCLDLPPMVFTDIPYEIGPRQRARYNELVLEMKASAEPAMQFSEIRSVNGRVAPEDIPGYVGHETQLLGLPHGAARVNKLLQVVSGFVINGPDSTICDGCPKLDLCAKHKVKPYTQACAVIQKPPPSKIVRDVENPKKELFEDLLSNILESDSTNKVLVWGSYLPELDDMVETCKNLGVGYVRVDGSNTNRIKEWEEMFQGDPKCRVYVGQVSSGIGVTLTAANYTIYYSLPWDSVKYRQSLERNNRPGQTRKMTVYRLLATNTLDQFVAQTLSFKEHIAYTLVEKVACATCAPVNRERCTREQNHPFRRGCIYQDGAARPVAPVSVVNPLKVVR